MTVRHVLVDERGHYVANAQETEEKHKRYTVRFEDATVFDTYAEAHKAAIYAEIPVELWRFQRNGY